ncbi:repressor LexA [Cyanobacterium stanieri LEGE 03274]|uniref:LexA repressor n=1 Tax=Cyanobacterium stanieri LEGE 03274 TaxID=1828756 RepID=A0ABR9V0C0_9CHRO|nr:transcriptional repressor LexA [Cyanobacterium stanieri]MBE9221322.1 repressor LexA [Cyanobacterium stanieri LEGE 03274]
MENLTPAQKELYDWLVEYINVNKYSPSIREMMKAMNLRSPAPIQSRLERIKAKGYIDWIEGQARTMKILKPYNGLPILGTITAGGLVEPFTDDHEKLDVASMFNQPNCFALKVVGDSMIEDFITEGDYVIMKSSKEAKEGEIVAARVDGYGTTLKRIYFNPEEVILKASNPKYDPIKVAPENVEIQGTLFAVCRLGY